jgi:multidrug resistance efflux pump
MKDRLPHRSGHTIITFLAVLVCAVGVIGIIIVVARAQSKEDARGLVLLHSVEQGDFEAFVTEPGDVASSSNVEVRCRVKSRGSPGAPILRICEEGTRVKPGDFLIQFDDSVLQNELLAQKIVVAQDKAQLIQADSNLENARRTLREFDEGLYELELELLEGAVFLAEEELQRSKAALKHSERLAAHGFITTVQLESNEFNVKKATKDAAAARRKLNVYREFTRERTLGEYSAEIDKQVAIGEAAKFTLELSKQKLADIEDQISHCLVEAPAAGQVVHANDRDGGESPEVIEEGIRIRENQIVIRLPDLTNMQVDVKINESHVNHVKPGQPAEIELDADPDNVLRGIVKKVAPYPFPLRWHGAPLEYGAVITIIDPPPTIRPGLRAKVKIVFYSKSNVLQVPLAAVVDHGDQHYCLVRERAGWRAQSIQIGLNNNTHVIVEHGLAIGDQVTLTPFRFIKRSELPDMPTGIATDKKPRSGLINSANSAAAEAPAS